MGLPTAWVPTGSPSQTEELQWPSDSLVALTFSDVSREKSPRSPSTHAPKSQLRGMGSREGLASERGWGISPLQTACLTCPLSQQPGCGRHVATGKSRPPWPRRSLFSPTVPHGSQHPQILRGAWGTCSGKKERDFPERHSTPEAHPARSPAPPPSSHGTKAETHPPTAAMERKAHRGRHCPGSQRQWGEVRRGHGSPDFRHR